MLRELFINVVKDYVLFSLLESIILSMFFYYVGDLKKMKWYEIIIMGIGNAIISQLFPVVIYQVFMIFWMIILLYKINKIKEFIIVIKNSILGMSLLLICEAFISILYSNIDISLINGNKLIIFTYMIPIRCLEFFMIGVLIRMKAWFGTGVKRK